MKLAVLRREQQEHLIWLCGWTEAWEYNDSLHIALPSSSPAFRLLLTVQGTYLSACRLHISNMVAPGSAIPVTMFCELEFGGNWRKLKIPADEV
jgi:hypothetical protein